MDLAAGVDLAAYCVIQESLTNTLKHAGDARATVVVRYTETAVELELGDDGHGASGTNGSSGAGRGLVGMRERVFLYGGSLHSGDRPGGGYLVTARLPVTEPLR